VTRRRRVGFNQGSRRCGAAAFRRALWAEAHQARRLPRTAPPVTGRCGPRRIPLPHPPAPRPGRQHSRRVRQSPGSVTATGAGTPRIVRAGPSSVKGTRRSFQTAPQKRSSGPTLERRRPTSGPDGEGQAEGQARRRAANLCTGSGVRSRAHPDGTETTSRRFVPSGGPGSDSSVSVHGLFGATGTGSQSGPRSRLTKGWR
jgi:hypothetical protein